ncbi:abortive infection family protein [Burkholderia arboris]|uniref:abortive infection family protein n=1 Tax=Burkholderia arboris TaxID=488730 RepID=UPI001CA3BDE3|nr:abortive infection family protein [Burkholderia arboris]MBY8608167.1 abortive infection family protein [Burkholderia arboris]
MRDKLNAFAAQHRRIEAKRDELIQRARAFHAEMNEAFASTKIVGRSVSVTLEEYGFGEAVYGCLSYGERGVQICHRTTEQDAAEAFVPPEHREDDVTSLEAASIEWLQLILTDETLESLFHDISDRLDAQVGPLDTSLHALQTILAAESAEIDTQMKASLTALASGAVAKNWEAALDATHMETADALTRATRMLESVCAAILIDRGVPLPSDKSLSPLLKACVNNLGLPDLPELQPDLKQLLGGVASICGGAAALRTHFGTAHGATSHFEPLDAAFGVLAKNTCAAAAIFLIDRHKHGDDPHQQVGLE